MAEKQLESTVRAAAYQKAWFAQLREDVFEKQKPYAIVQADMPLELFHAMDVPVVSNQWWAAMVAAKRLAPHYLDGLNALGFHDGLCRYCSLSLAAAMSLAQTLSAEALMTIALWANRSAAVGIEAVGPVNIDRTLD